MTTTSERPGLTRRVAASAAAVLFLCCAAPGAAQVVVQDARGRDVMLDNFNLGLDDVLQTILALNSGGQTVKGRLVFPTGNTVNQQFHSFEVQYQAADGVVDLFQGNRVSDVQSFGYRYGRSHLLLSQQDRDIDFLVLGADYSTATYRLFDPAAPAADQLSSRDFNGIELHAQYFRLIQGSMRAGLNFGYRRDNNYTDLRSVEVHDGRTLTGGGDTRFVVTRKTSAREGEFERFEVFPVGLSFVTMPSEDSASAKKVKPGFAAYTFAELARGESAPITAGINLNLTRPDPDTEIRGTVGGLFVEASDLFDIADAGDGLLKRVRVGVFVNVMVLEF
jgi:hypothetical protein